MKKYIIMLLAILMFASTAYAQNDKDYVVGDTCHTMMDKWFGDEVRLMSADIEAERVIADYMDLRLASLTDNADFEVDYLSETVAENERIRRTAIAEMEKGKAIDITDAATHLSFVYGEDGIIEVREWIFYDYDDLDVEGVGLNVSGFGVTHYITLEETENGYIIVSDEYDETAETGMNTLSPERREDIAQLSEEIIEDEYATLSYTHYPSYDANAAVAYSDKYALNYNSAYYNFASLGGDCANFTSQCIYAGGMPQVVGSNYGNNCWFYVKSNNRSATWTGANQLCNWMANNRGNKIVKASASQIYKGSPVFFDWENDGKWNHATFCVGKNAEGSPIINGHTSDQYHAKVDMSQQYCVVQLTAADPDAMMNVGTNMMQNFFGPHFDNVCTYADGSVKIGLENDLRTYSYVRLSNGAYTIRSSYYGTYLTADSDGVVRARPYTGAYNQQWYFYDSSYTDKLYVKSAAYANGYLFTPSTNRIGAPLKFGALASDVYYSSFELKDWTLPSYFTFDVNTEYGGGLTELTWIARAKDGARIQIYGISGYTLEIYNEGTLYRTYDVEVSPNYVHTVLAELEPGNYSAIAKAKVYGTSVSTQVVEFTVENSMYPVKINATAAHAETTSGYVLPHIFDISYELSGVKEDDEYNVIQALYDEDGRLLGAYIDVMDSMSSLVINEDVKTFKFMVFEDFEDVKPLAESVEINLE